MANLGEQKEFPAKIEAAEKQLSGLKLSELEESQIHQELERLGPIFIEQIRSSLKENYGLYLSAAGIAKCGCLLQKDKLSEKDVWNIARDVSLKHIGEAILPEQGKKGDLVFPGLLTLQVVSVRNLTAPTIKQESQHASRMLGLVLSDGFGKVQAVEVNSIPSLGLQIPPGAKIKLRNVKIVRGIIPLDIDNVVEFSGSVADLENAWKMKKEAEISRAFRSTLAEGEAPPPPFVPFSVKASRNVLGQTEKQKGSAKLTETTKSSEELSKTQHGQRAHVNLEYEDNKAESKQKDTRLPAVQPQTVPTCFPSFDTLLQAPVNWSGMFDITVLNVLLADHTNSAGGLSWSLTDGQNVISAHSSLEAAIKGLPQFAGFDAAQLARLMPVAGQSLASKHFLAMLQVLQVWGPNYDANRPSFAIISLKEPSIPMGSQSDTMSSTSSSRVDTNEPGQPASGKKGRGRGRGHGHGHGHGAGPQGDRDRGRGRGRGRRGGGPGRGRGASST